MLYMGRVLLSPQVHTPWRAWTRSNCPFASPSWEGRDPISHSSNTHRRDPNTATFLPTHWYHPWPKNHKYLLLPNPFLWSQGSPLP